MRRGLWIASCVAAVSLAGTASAQWSDGFDAYAVGGLVPQGGWEYWDDIPAGQAFVTDTFSRSAPNAVEISPTSDIVYTHGPVSSGRYQVSGWSYVPSSAVNGDQYFILLNHYNSGGGPRSWSLQLQFILATGVVVDVDGGGAPAVIVRDQWVQVRVEIDLDADTQTVFYDGAMLFTKSWSQGSLNPLGDPGTVTYGTLDLFSDAGDSIFWDDMAFSVLAPVPVVETTWGQIKSSYR